MASKGVEPPIELSVSGAGPVSQPESKPGSIHQDSPARKRAAVPYLESPFPVLACDAAYASIAL